MRSLRYFLMSFVILFAAASVARGQITNNSNDQATPIPGVGHDYLKCSQRRLALQWAGLVSA